VRIVYLYLLDHSNLFKLSHLIRSICLIIPGLLITCLATGQQLIRGCIHSSEGPLPFASVIIPEAEAFAEADSTGCFYIEDLQPGSYSVKVSYLGYRSQSQTITLAYRDTLEINFNLTSTSNTMEEIVVTGTMKAVRRLDSPVPVELYTPAFFRKNPSTNLFEALENINGVRPQINCNVCNTGDIHINGLEGPYTMVLIDGMPIVSSLATVYGLSGIPQALIDKMEIVKGPASSLYGSEAIGGLINVITKSPASSPRLSIDLMTTSWQEINTDIGFSLPVSEKISTLTGINYFRYNNPVDNNGDNFTDVTLQDRVSVFHKWNIERKDNRLFNIAARYFYENRWGGEMNWTPEFRGSDIRYGESIYTTRWEILGQYQLPFREKLMFSFSYNHHDQNSVYGDIPYLALQKIGFAQMTFEKTWGQHDFLAGTALRYNFYDDNTPATGGPKASPDNQPDRIWLPGFFIQNEWHASGKSTFLMGMRYDYNNRHGHIWTPRMAWKFQLGAFDVLRLNAGTGFRIVNLFTEDHAALTGARDLMIVEKLRPERSYNINLNYSARRYFDNGAVWGLECSAWYTHFTNAIIPDYNANPNLIIYDNLDGYAVSKGISLNADFTLADNTSLSAGATLMDVSSTENGTTTRQLLTERFSGSGSISHSFMNNRLTVDYTATVYSPMLLPLLGPLDPRPPRSPWWSIQNIKFSFDISPSITIYSGIKNILDWTPWKNQDHPIIARSFDPFDRGVSFDSSGQALPSESNPYALTFDPSYVYGPNQGRRVFLGFRMSL